MITKKSSIYESFATKRVEAGQVKFSTVQFTDSHIKKAIADAAKALNIPESKILAQVNEKVAAFADIKAKSPLLYETIAINIIESEVYNFVADNKVTLSSQAPTFSWRTFVQLKNMIRAEHSQFRTLKNKFRTKEVTEPSWILVPSSDPEFVKYNSVHTAAATSGGDFIFNLEFMQNLLNWAALKNIQPKGKKYNNNGGPIPKEYAYIEFLILHELMHYTYGDFNYAKLYKVNPMVSNWVGDFRSNYLLVKSGYEQLPIGLFNDAINYDRQKTYREMVEIVKAEFNKLNEQQQKMVGGQLDKMGDDHTQGGGGGQDEQDEQDEQGGGGGQGGGRDKKDEKDNQGGKGGGKGKKDEKDNQEGKGDQSDESDEQEVTEEDVDRAHKEIEDSIKKGAENANKEVSKDKKGADGPKSSPKGRPGSARGSGLDFDYNSIVPQYNWQALLEKCVRSATVETEETYARVSTRSATQAHIAKQLGAAPVKPGEVITENNIKLLFVVDSSGSMSDVIARVYAEIVNLLKSGRKIDKDFYLMKFSSNFEIYKCSLARNHYTQVDAHLQPMNQGNTGDIGTLFSSAEAGGTVFSSGITSVIKAVAAKSFNTLIMSDADISAPENQKNIVSVLGTPGVFLLLDSRESFIAFSKALKTVHNNVSCITD